MDEHESSWQIPNILNHITRSSQFTPCISSIAPEILIPARQRDPRVVNLDYAIRHRDCSLHLPHALRHVPGEPFSVGIGVLLELHSGVKFYSTIAFKTRSGNNVNGECDTNYIQYGLYLYKGCMKMWLPSFSPVLSFSSFLETFYCSCASLEWSS